MSFGQNSTRESALYVVAELSRRLSAKDRDGLRRACRDMVSEARCDPMALETLWLSVVEGGATPTVSLPLTQLLDLGDDELFVNYSSGSVPVAALLKLVSDRLTMEAPPRTSSARGDWRPLVLLLLAGPPADGDAAAQNLDLLSRHPSRPIVIVMTTCDLPFTAPFVQLLTDNPLVMQFITGKEIHRAWSYYRPFGPYWEDSMWDSQPPVA